MKKLIPIAALLFSTATVASTQEPEVPEVLQCSTQTLVLDGNTIFSDVPVSNGYIELTHDQVTLSVKGNKLFFWKDGNEYRNNTGAILLDKKAHKYTMETAIPQENSTEFVPAKITYTCE